jgi:hypothetical protein
MIQHATASAAPTSRPDGPARRSSGDGSFLALLTSRAASPASVPEAGAGDGQREAAAGVTPRGETGEGDEVTAEGHAASDPDRTVSGAPDAWRLVARTLAAAGTDVARSAERTDTADLDDLDDLDTLGALLAASTVGGDLVPTAPIETADLPDRDASDLGHDTLDAVATAAGSTGAKLPDGSPTGLGGQDPAVPGADAVAATPRTVVATAGRERHLDGLEVDEVRLARTAPRDRATIDARGELPRAHDATATSAPDEPAVTPLLEATPTDRSAGARSEGTAALTSTTLTRLLDAIERLEQAPPPRQLTIELGEVRVRLALEDGALRLQLLGDQRDGDRALLREAAEALAARGFDLHPDDDGGRGAGPPAQGSTEQGSGTPRPRAAARTAARLPAAGLHL